MIYDYKMEKKNDEMRRSLVERIRSARIQAGFTQEALAERLMISRVSIGKYESGEIEPKLKRLKEIAEVLNTSTDYLLGIKINDGISGGLSLEAANALDRFITEIIRQYNMQNKNKNAKREKQF